MKPSNPKGIEAASAIEPLPLPPDNEDPALNQSEEEQSKEERARLLRREAINEASKETAAEIAGVAKVRAKR